MTWARLPMSTNWKNTNYDSIFVIIDRLKKMLRNELVQIPIDASWLPDSIDLDSVLTSKS